MASLENMKKIMVNYGTDNFLSLVADVLFNDVSEIREFKIYDMYYLNDIVLVPASVSGQDKDRLFICKRNGVKGAFNSDDWSLYMLTSQPSQGLLENKRYTASADNTSTINLGFDIVLEKHKLTITHSVRGRLIEGVDWEMQDRHTVKFKGLTLFEGEYVDIDIYE